MVSIDAQYETEEYLGLVPAEKEAIADAAADHMWAFVRDFHFDETEFSAREKSLVGLGAAATIKEPFCIRYYRSDASVHGLTDEEIKETITVSSSVQFFSTMLQGSEVDLTGLRRSRSARIAIARTRAAGERLIRSRIGFNGRKQPVTR